MNTEDRFQDCAYCEGAHAESDCPERRVMKHLIRIDHDLFIRLQALAEKDKRSVTVLVAVLLEKAIKEL